MSRPLQHAHTNPHRHPDDIERPTPAPVEIDETTPNTDETGTQREYEEHSPDRGPSREANGPE